LTTQQERKRRKTVEKTVETEAQRIEKKCWDWLAVLGIVVLGVFVLAWGLPKYQARLKFHEFPESTTTTPVAKKVSAPVKIVVPKVEVILPEVTVKEGLATVITEADLNQALASAKSGKGDLNPKKEGGDKTSK